jgi:ubiquinone/menaquinone biosynthesis C-methylase UbiE
MGSEHFSFEDQGHFARWNEKMAHKYDPESYHLRSNVLIRWIERRRVRAITRFLDANRRDAVLEVGCGAGNVLEQVQLGQLYGIDLSAFLLQKSRQRLFHRQARLVRANAERLPFADGRFQKLVCTEVLEHVIDPRRVASEMARVATTDAVLVISIPNEGWINRIKKAVRAFGLERWLLRGGEGAYSSPDRMTDEWHLHSFDLSLLKEVCEGILLIREVRAVPFKLIPLRYVACCHVAFRGQIEPNRK